MTNKARLILTEGHLGALVAPRTREVFDAFVRHGPMTVPDLQGRLGTDSKSAYYQVAKLGKVGLLRVRGTQGAKEATVYELAGRNPYMPDGFQGLRYERLAAKGVTATLKKASRRFSTAAEATKADPSLADDQYILTSTLRLSESNRRALRSELRALHARFQKREDPKADRALGIVFLTTPIVEPN